MSYNLNENLKRSASNFPESIAYIYGDKSVTYQELNQKVDRLAAGLYVQGIRKGDGVALILGNSPEFLIAYYGILRLGAFVVPINPLYTQGEINYLLDNSQAKASNTSPGTALAGDPGALPDVLAERRRPSSESSTYTRWHPMRGSLAWR